MSRLLLKLFASTLLLSASAGAFAQDARTGAPAESTPDCGLLARSRKVDEYGDLSAAEEKSRLDKLAAALAAEDEDTKAFVIGYAGRDGRAGAGLARADRAKQTLIDKSTSYNTRINTLDCGRREVASTEFWITPAGASPPRCSPTFAPTPAPAKGVVRRTAPRRRRRRL